MNIDPIFHSILLLVFLKSIFIGSEFSFYYWIKYGKKYTNWYSKRPTFQQHLETDTQEERICAHIGEW